MENDRVPFSECTEYLYRLQRDELVQLCQYMNIELSGRISKGEIISRIRENYSLGFSLDQLAIIDIMYTIQRLGKYKWYAYGLQAATEKGGPSVNPQMITSRILKELEPLIYCHVYSTINNGLLWIRILLVQPVQGEFEYIPSDNNETRVVFLTHLLGSNYIFTSSLPSSLRDTVLTSVSLALQQSRCEPLHLSGSDVRTFFISIYDSVDSLLRLVLNTSAGGFADYLNQLKEKRPLERGSIQSTVPFLLKHCPPNVHYLDEESIRKNHEQSELDWGIAEPPAIQDVYMNTNVSWSEEDIDLSNIHMNIHLHGTNVMKGLKQLTAFGYATKIPVQISFDYSLMYFLHDTY